ncbi:hypothetical protein ANRL3_00945 [Anaerolineae bacterium]|nr:hypothetical protein ANRL3_00945 [Anaerolineae bacterium]
MKDALYHLPFGLVALWCLGLFATDFVFGANARVMATLLAPVLWLGLYWLAGISSTPKDER